MPQQYEPEFKMKIVRLHLDEGRTFKSITDEYGLVKSTIAKWCKEYREDCLSDNQHNKKSRTELETMEENSKLRKELEETRKENLFLKKAAAFFAKEIG